MPPYGYRALTYPLHSNISASILSLTLYELVGNFTCNYLTQPILENASLLIGIVFTSTKNLTKWAYSLTNSPAFTLHWHFHGFFQCLDVPVTHHPLREVLHLHELSLILLDARIITLAYLASLPFYNLHLIQSRTSSLCLT